MLNLVIEKLSIRTQTNDGLYGTDIPFTQGLNIIHAENTHGKSTCIQSIVYALGLEGCLGPSRKVPLKTALTSQLRVEGGRKVSVIGSKIYLQISNSSKRMTIMRSSNEDRKDLISVYFDLSVEEVLERNDIESSDYYLRVEGAASRERGFHYLLADFLEIELPRVTKYNGGESPLYLEAIFAMNYVEQTRGWGGILNILPTYLGIKELSERVIEFTLDLDARDVAKRRQEHTQKKKDAERVWELALDNLMNEAKRTYGFVSNQLDEKIGKKTQLANGSYLYFYDSENAVPYKERIENLNTALVKLKQEFTNSKLDSQKLSKLERDLEQQQTLLSRQEKSISMLLSDLSVSDKYFVSIKDRIHDVQDSLRKYKDLQRLEEIGSQENFSIVQKQCPTCHRKMPETLLTELGDSDSKVLGLSDNIKYLEKQLDAYNALAKGEELKLEKKENLLRESRSELTKTRALIRSIKDSLIDSTSVPSRSDIKKELLLEGEISSLEKALRSEEEIKGNMEEALLSWGIAEKALSALPFNGLSANDRRKLSSLKNSFVNSLEAFGYSSSDLKDFEISERSFKPALNEVDINSEASASDNIRVIWSYLYSMLTLDSASGQETNHLGLLILDEPRQQEAKNESFQEFIVKSSEVKKIGKQIIIGTSEDYNNLQSAISGLDVELKHFDSYIIGKL